MHTHTKVNKRKQRAKTVVMIREGGETQREGNNRNSAETQKKREKEKGLEKGEGKATNSNRPHTHTHYGGPLYFQYHTVFHSTEEQRSLPELVVDGLKGEKRSQLREAHD